MGTFGLFFTFFLLFLRFIPLIAIAEVKGVTPQADPHHPLGGAKNRRAPLMAAELQDLTASSPSLRIRRTLMHAAEKVRDAGFRKWDVFTPFPVHGMDKAMGIKNSKVGWFSFIGGVHRLHQRHVDDLVDERGGLSRSSSAANRCSARFGAFPPSYELTILLGSFGALLGMLFLNRLPRLHHPLLKNRRFALATHDRFFLVIETSDPKYSRNRNPQAAGIARQPAHRNGGGINALFPAHIRV